MKRHAQAIWRGTLKDGKGNLTTGSGALSAIPYTFRMRFENEEGTNPEELVAAAHAGCFSMAFANNLAAHDVDPESIETRGEVTFEKVDAGWRLQESHLMVNVRVPGADRKMVEEAAEKAKEGCPISNALSIPIRLTLEVQV